ncbi:endogenous retrovirus group K member 8 Pol [Labeo rohita]|nr:endogenous retrovirus group K member 8 Pol [Labeo rohita]
MGLEYTELSKPLTEALKGGKPGMELIEWTEEMEEALVSIKETLSSCPALRHADARKAFHLWTWVGTKSYSAALGQRVPGRTSYGMVGYYSTPIPASMAGQHPCLLICDCAEWAVKATEEVVAHQKVMKGLLTTVRSLLDTDPLPHAMRLFVDGSSFHENGQRYTGWAVVNEHEETVDYGSLSGGGAQIAELIALTRALQFGRAKRINVYTDSCYAYGIVHDFGPV